MDGNPQQGEVVISGKVNGPNQKGRSRAEIQQAIQSTLRGEVDPVGEQKLPRSKRDQVKEYFSVLHQHFVKVELLKFEWKKIKTMTPEDAKDKMHDMLKGVAFHMIVHFSTLFRNVFFYFQNSIFLIPS